MNLKKLIAKTALHENLVKEQEEIISKYEDRLKVASKDEHFGIKSAISNHKAMLQSLNSIWKCGEMLKRCIYFSLVD